jgi:hypothetical protein
MRIKTSCLLLAGLASWLLSAAGFAAPVRALTIEGQAIEGAWLGMEGDKFKFSVEGKETLLAPDQLMGLHWMATTSRPASVTTRPGDEVLVHLADGSRFNAQITGAQGETIQLQTGLMPELELKLSQMAAIRFSQEASPAADKAFAEALASRDPTQDTLFVAQDGKVNAIRGTLEKLTESGGTFKWRNRSVPVDRARMFAVVLATGAGTPPAPQARCVLTDRSVWAGRLVGGDQKTVQLELDAGPTLTIAVDLLSDIRFRNDHMQFLSDLEPSNYQFKPWGTTQWPYRKDRSAANRPIQIGGQLFDRGIGMHSAGSLTYTLNEPFRQFAATVGIDDAVGSRGNVVFRVLADGREVFNSGPVTGRDDPTPVLVTLNGAKTLQLIVDYGDDLDIGDQADWGNARLIK